MGISTSTNPWWRDVLANGPSAPSARFFDIDWNPFKTRAAAQAAAADSRRSVRAGARARRAAARVPGRTLLLRYFDTAAGQSAPGTRVYRTGLDELTAHLARRIRICWSSERHHALQKMPPYTDTSPDGIASGSARASWRRPAAGADLEVASDSAAHPERSPHLQRHTGDPHRSIRCTICSRSRPTGSRTGGRRRTRSTTAGSSTSTRWPGCASRIPTSLAPSTSCWRG